MIICVCKAVSDKHIRAAVADGVTSLRQLTRELRVGTCCGKCLPEAKAELNACVAQAGNPSQRCGSGSPPVFFGASAPELAA